VDLAKWSGLVCRYIKRKLDTLLFVLLQIQKIPPKLPLLLAEEGIVSGARPRRRCNGGLVSADAGDDGGE
jgi:hypothetical protein